MKQAPATVSRIVERALGATVAQCVTPQTVAVAETYLLHLRDGRRDCPAKVVCKIGGGNIWTGEVIEPEVTCYIGQHTSLPVPAVIASGSVQTIRGPRRWGLYEYCEGSVPDGFELRSYEPVVSQAGQLLGQLHDAWCFDSLGEFTREAGELTTQPPGLKNLVARHPSRSNAWQPVLAHGDYHPGNLLTESGSVSAVLDWGNAHVTDAGYSLARAEARFIDLPPVR